MCFCPLMKTNGAYCPTNDNINIHYKWEEPSNKRTICCHIYSVTHMKLWHKHFGHRSIIKLGEVIPILF